MVKKGCKACAMEASSHGLQQGRLEGCHFDGAAFTNLTPEPKRLSPSTKANPTLARPGSMPNSTALVPFHGGSPTRIWRLKPV
ncbi:Mur ligase family protein [Acetomicrobium sp. S15 = DSM 107314]|uniref:Mur ligase family protein n=1 Tax=Acetomicrobium sp. S15 = DSM 107314 TaxID=2529858 RepID=UPI00406D3B7A